MRLVLSFLLCIVQVACMSRAQQIETILTQVKAERKPLTRVPVKLEVPANYDKRDLDNGKFYDHKPRVIVVDEKAGKYEFRWIGSDRKEKVIKYQRLGAIDVLVSAKARKIETGTYSYTYTVQNLLTSVNRLSGFTVQTFASVTKPIEFDFDNSYIGPMSDLIPGFKEGKWLNYSILSSYRPAITPGSRIDLELQSPALPGLVGCKADGGKFGMKGVGEDMPPELEKLSLGTKDWPYGYTIGPVDKLTDMNTGERSEYFLENLPKFVEVGWMAGDTPKIYESILKRGDLSGALEQAKKDLELGFITAEVFHIIEGLSS